MDLTFYQVMTGLFCATALSSIGFFAGHFAQSRRARARATAQRDEMLTIERALKAFWDNEKQKLESEKTDLQQRIQFLEIKLEQYRRKAAGVGMMGLRKNKLSDMLITLLIENESLEEKLFQQNLKLKQERDEFLENELRNISYKRILLSELLNQAEVRREMEKVINDRSRLKRLELKQKDQGIIEDAPADDDGDEEKAVVS